MDLGPTIIYTSSQNSDDQETVWPMVWNSIHKRPPPCWRQTKVNRRLQFKNKLFMPTTRKRNCHDDLAQFNHLAVNDAISVMLLVWVHILYHFVSWCLPTSLGKKKSGVWAEMASTPMDSAWAACEKIIQCNKIMLLRITGHAKYKLELVFLLILVVLNWVGQLFQQENILKSLFNSGRSSRIAFFSAY